MHPNYRKAKEHDILCRFTGRLSFVISFYLFMTYWFCVSFFYRGALACAEACMAVVVSPATENGAFFQSRMALISFFIVLEIPSVHGIFLLAVDYLD
jgi:hypothetical protein